MRHLIILGVIGGLIGACGNETNVRTTPSGYDYEFLHDEPGPVVEPGQIVHFWTTVLMGPDSLLYSSRANGGKPMTLQIPVDAQRRADDIAPVQDVLSYASVGDSVRLVYPVDSLQNKVPGVPEGSSLNYDLVVVQIMSVEEYQEYLKRDSQPSSSGEEDKNWEQIVGDSVRSYHARYVSGELDDRIVRTASGLGYIMTEAGEPGTRAVEGDLVKAHYYGVLAESGAPFDNSLGRNQTFDFTLGAREAIDGWDEMFRLLNKNGSAIIFVPSDLAYGSQGYGAIPPDADLIFFVYRVE